MDYQVTTVSSTQINDNVAGHLTTPFFVQSAVDGLASTSAAFLTSSSPTRSTSAPPAFKPSTISPFQPSQYTDLLAKPVMTVHELELRDALIEAEFWD